MTTNFGWIDYLIIVVYLAALTGIGIYFSRRQKNLEDFFLAGRSMGWLPIGLSLMAALNSGIDYIMVPGATIRFGIVFMAAIFSWLFLYPWVAYVMLPFYRRLKIFSVYEYLERRFDVTVRTLAASIFLLWRLGWMATALYVPCLAITAVTGGQLPLIPLIIVLGAVVTLYTMLGGIEAVIWTDVVQFFIMFLGLGVTVWVVVSNVPGGVAAILKIAHAEGKTDIIGNISAGAGAGVFAQIKHLFSNPDTIVGVLIASIVGRMSMYTSDQVMMQRFQTTRSLQGARRAFVTNSAGDALWTISLAFVGLSLFAFYKANVLPPEIAANTDQIFPYFMSTVFPTGVTGLVIAAILAASLSSIDSAINSCTSVVMVDFYNRFVGRRRAPDEKLTEAEQRSQVRVSRITTAVFGFVGIVLATQVSRIGMVINIAFSVIQTFTGPLLGIYLLGMFSERTRSLGVLIGGIVGTGVSLYLAFYTKLGFVWPTVFGLIASLIIGYLASLLVPGTTSPEARQLTWRNVVRLPLLDEEENEPARS